MAHHLTSDHPILGLGRVNGAWEPLPYEGDAHLLTIARTRAGKGRCVIIPNLASYAGSVIVLDPKGENTVLTAQWREDNGQAVHVFDPFKVVKERYLPSNGRASFNPIDLVRSSPSPITVAMLIAEAMIIPTERDPHWGEAARSVFAAYIMYVAFSDDLEPDEVDIQEGYDTLDQPRTLGTAWKFFTSPDLAEDVLESLLGSDDPFVSAQAYRLVEGAKAGGQEIASVRNTFYTQCNMTFSEPLVAAALDTSTVNFSELGGVPTSIYIVLPGWATPNHKRFMRLLLNCAMAQIEMAGLPEGGSHDNPNPPTLFILDEFATLGKMPSLVESMGRMAGYNIMFWPFVQNVSQLKAHEMYGDGWTAIAGNTGVLQYFGGTNCLDTVNYLSTLLGEMTGVIESQNLSTNFANGIGTTISKYQRKLMTIDEIVNLPCNPKLRTGQQLLVQTGIGPVNVQDTAMIYYDRYFPDFNKYLAVRDHPTPTLAAKTAPASAAAPVRKSAGPVDIKGFFKR